MATKLSEFGKAVRHARIDLDMTMEDMSKELGVSIAFLSSIERGIKKIPINFSVRISKLFESRGVFIQNLPQLAAISNNEIRIAGLPLRQQLVIARLSSLCLSDESLDQIESLLS